MYVTSFLKHGGVTMTPNVSFLPFFFLLVFASVNHLSFIFKILGSSLWLVVEGIYWVPETLPKRASGEYWKKCKSHNGSWKMSYLCHDASTQCLYFSVFSAILRNWLSGNYKEIIFHSTVFCFPVSYTWLLNMPLVFLIFRQPAHVENVLFVSLPVVLL